MKTIVFAASKGGVGKTTLCAALSSFASSASKKKKIAIVDLDPQGSLTAWWNQRQAESPELIEASAGNLSEMLEKAASAGYDYVL
jgi:chromosome partitioning protein